MPPTLWVPAIATGVMMGAHWLLMRSEPRDARTPLWKWSVVMFAGLLTIFVLASLIHGALPLFACVLIASLSAAVLGGLSWFVQRRLEDTFGGWR
jgi:hypothetical protein